MEKDKKNCEHELYISYINPVRSKQGWIGFQYTCVKCKGIGQIHTDDIGQKLGDKYYE